MIRPKFLQKARQRNLLRVPPKTVWFQVNEGTSSPFPLFPKFKEEQFFFQGVDFTMGTDWSSIGGLEPDINIRNIISQDCVS
jgi:hypothetical protein